MLLYARRQSSLFDCLTARKMIATTKYSKNSEFQPSVAKRYSTDAQSSFYIRTSVCETQSHRKSQLMKMQDLALLAKIHV